MNKESKWTTAVRLTQKLELYTNLRDLLKQKDVIVEQGVHPIRLAQRDNPITQYSNALNKFPAIDEKTIKQALVHWVDKEIMTLETKFKRLTEGK